MKTKLTSKINWNNLEEVKEYKKKYYQKNKKEILQKNRGWKKKNKNHCKEYEKTRKSTEEYRKRNREWTRHKKIVDKKFVLAKRLRDSLGGALEHYTKTGKIYSSIKYGINYQLIIEHLKPFPKDLINYEIHHIKPLHTFNFINKDGSTNLKEVKKAFAPKNLILLTKEEHKNINHPKLIKFQNKN